MKGFAENTEGGGNRGSAEILGAVNLEVPRAVYNTGMRVLCFATACHRRAANSRRGEEDEESSLELTRFGGHLMIWG